MLNKKKNNLVIVIDFFVFMRQDISRDFKWIDTCLKNVRSLCFMNPILPHKNLSVAE